MWQYWTQRQLQEDLDDEAYDFIEIVLSALNPEAALMFQGSNRKLAKLIEAMKEHTYFRKIDNLRLCFERLPKQVFDDLCAELGFDIAHGSLNPLQVAKAVRGDTEKLALLVSRFGLNQRFLSTNQEAPPRRVVNRAASESSPKAITKPFKTLKDYQLRCVLEVERYLEVPRGRVLLQMPTGSGKTRTAMEVIAAQLNTGAQSQVVWLANTRELCEQAVQCFTEVWDHVGRYDCEIIRHWDSGTDSIEEWSGSPKVFTVLGLQSAWALWNKDSDEFTRKFSSTSLLVVDEAHIAVAPTYLEIINRILQGSSVKLLGLTATPARQKLEETEFLSDLFLGSIVTLASPNPERQGAIAFLREKGVLSSVRFTPIAADSTVSLSSSDLKKLRETGDYSESFLKALGNDALRTVRMMELVVRRLEQGKRVIIFCPSVRNSFLVSSILGFLEFRSAHISGATASATRDSLIRQFVDGDLQVLCNYGVLSTGFDAPKVDTVVVARPTKSAVLYSQMIGRGMRGPAVGGTKSCEVIEVLDVFLQQAEQDVLFEDFSEYWED